MSELAPVPRVALRFPEEVAAALGVSADFVQDHGLAAELRVVRRGRLKLVSVAELQRWADENGAFAGRDG